MTLFGVHAQLDDLERDAAADRFFLLGHVNDAAAAFADLLQQFVAADPVAGLFSYRNFNVNGSFGNRVRRATPEKILNLLMRVEQILHPLTQCNVTSASFVQISGALRSMEFQRRV